MHSASDLSTHTLIDLGLIIQLHATTRMLKDTTRTLVVDVFQLSSKETDVINEPMDCFVEERVRACSLVAFCVRCLIPRTRRQVKEACCVCD